MKEIYKTIIIYSASGFIGSIIATSIYLSANKSNHDNILHKLNNNEGIERIIKIYNK